MKLWQNVFANVGGIGLAVAAESLKLIPAKYAIVAAIAQAVISTIAHYYNTDGTPQAQAGPK